MLPHHESKIVFLTLVVFSLSAWTSLSALTNGIQEIALCCNINAGNFIVGCWMELLPLYSYLSALIDLMLHTLN